MFGHPIVSSHMLLHWITLTQLLKIRSFGVATLQNFPFHVLQLHNCTEVNMESIKGQRNEFKGQVTENSKIIYIIELYFCYFVRDAVIVWKCYSSDILESHYFFFASEISYIFCCFFIFFYQSK